MDNITQLVDALNELFTLSDEEAQLIVDEFELLIRLVGLKRVNRYGNFNFEEYGAEHYNVVYEIKK